MRDKQNLMKKKKNFWQRLKGYILRPKREVKIVLEKKAIKEIREAISQELQKIISSIKKEIHQELSKIRETKQIIEPRKIKIKKSFINPIEKDVLLKSHFVRLPKKKITSGASLEKSLKALKKYQIRPRKK